MLYAANVPMVIISEHNVFLQSRLLVGTLCQVWPFIWPGEIIFSRPGSSQNQHATVFSQIGGIDKVNDCFYNVLICKSLWIKASDKLLNK